MTYHTPAYTGRALDKAFPRPNYLIPFVWTRTKPPRPKPIKRDWLLVASEPATPNVISIAEIQKAVCEYFGVSRTDLLSDRRKSELVRQRQISMWLSRKLTTHSYPVIGRHHGGRDHTTILHGVRCITALMEKNADFAREINSIRLDLEVRFNG